MTRAGIYSRISEDATLEGKGVARQREDCEMFAARHGYEVVSFYEDNDISASTRSKKERPEYKAMLEAARNKEFDVIVAYSNSRLTRRLSELEDLIVLHDQHGTLINTVVSGQDDLSTADGRMVARIKASVDSAESERNAERVKRAIQQRAQQGLPQGGRKRLFGYTSDWQLHEEEAKIVKEAFERRASGESTTSIANDLAKRGIVTVAGKPWKAGTLSKTLDMPGYAGLRRYNGEIIGKTAYPSIIDEELFYRAQSNLVKDSKGTNTRKYLLSGFLICGKCLNLMKGHGGKYRCAQANGYDGCGGTMIKQQWIDNFVDGLVGTDILGRTLKEASENEPAPIDLSGEIEKVDALRQSYVDAHTSGALTLTDLLPLLESANKKRADLIKQQAEQPRRDLWIPVEAYQNGPLSMKRTIIEQYIKAILVKPGIRGSRKFDAARLQIVFTDGTETPGTDWYDENREVLRDAIYGTRRPIPPELLEQARKDGWIKDEQPSG